MSVRVVKCVGDRHGWESYVNIFRDNITKKLCKLFDALADDKAADDDTGGADDSIMNVSEHRA